MGNIKIAIVEDDLDYQQFILQELANAPGINCIGQYQNAEAAISCIPALKPDIVLMDLTLKGSKVDGIKCMLLLKLKLPELRFLVISNHYDEGMIFNALCYGAGAYIAKGEIYRKLADLIVEFYNGGAPMSPGIAARVVQFFHKPSEDLLLLDTLSDREKEILNLLSKGFLYKEIAGRLNVSDASVKQYCHKIYKKLEVNNRTEAILKSSMQ